MGWESLNQLGIGSRMESEIFFCSNPDPIDQPSNVLLSKEFLPLQEKVDFESI